MPARPAPPPITVLEPARGQHFSLTVVTLFVQLVLGASLSLRGVVRALAVVQTQLGLVLELPDWTTGRGWLLRVGYYKLSRPKERADDWVWLIDHSCQIGSEKCLVVLGIRLRALPPPGECLCLEDLEPLEILPVQSSTQTAVADQLTAVATKTGVPRAILRDDGSDLRGGVQLFQAQHPDVADLYDIKHKTACLLRHTLAADADWGAFQRHVGTTKCQVQQTELAFLAPPSQRLKARYMNLAELVRWGVQTLELVDRKPTTVREHVTAERLEEKLGWLRDYRTGLAEWSQLLTVANVAEDFVRRQGLYAGAGDDLATRRPPELTSLTAGKMWTDLLDHVEQQAAQVRPGERLPGSTEALESCFGKQKQLEKDQNRSGFTGLLLGIGAMVSKTTSEVVKNALEKCPIKVVWNWCQQRVGETVQSKRRLAYSEPTCAIETG